MVDETKSGYESGWIFYFNGVYFIDDHYELDITLNRYYKL